jgi:hypothetical protein
MTLDSQQAHVLAKRSASRRRRLVLEDVERELPPLDSAENVRLAAEQIQRWGAAGMLPGVVVGACIRACEIALRAIDSEFDAQRLKTLEAEVHRSRRRA